MDIKFSVSCFMPLMTRSGELGYHGHDVPFWSRSGHVLPKVFFAGNGPIATDEAGFGDNGRFVTCHAREARYSTQKVEASVKATI